MTPNQNVQYNQTNRIKKYHYSGTKNIIGTGTFCFIADEKKSFPLEHIVEFDISNWTIETKCFIGTILEFVQLDTIAPLEEIVPLEQNGTKCSIGTNIRICSIVTIGTKNCST